MVNKPTSELDIAQRIAKAVCSQARPLLSCSEEINPDEDTIIGVVPKHLRNLHNLLVEVYNERDGSIEKEVRYKAVHTIFYDSLGQHVPAGKFRTIKLCKGENWLVAGTTGPVKCT